MRALTSVITCALVGCGSGGAPPPIEILLRNDNSHACAGAVEMNIELEELNGDSVTRKVFPTAVAPEQVDCDFDVGVAEALYSVLVGEIETGVPYILTLELTDSTGLIVGVGGTSEPFTASATEAIDPIRIELTRAAPLGTVLLDLMLESGFEGVAGDVSVVVFAGIDAIGRRDIVWPGDDTQKRPLRISGLSGIGLNLLIELTVAGIVRESRVTETFSLTSDPDDAFVSPVLNPN